MISHFCTIYQGTCRYRFNTYFTVDLSAENAQLKDGYLIMGPLWDLDLGFGNIGYSIVGGNIFNMAALELWPTGWHYERNVQWLFPDVTLWFGRLLSDPWFHTLLTKRYARLRTDLWSTQNLNTFISNLTTPINSIAPSAKESPQERHQARWGTRCWKGNPSKGADHCHGIWPYLCIHAHVCIRW